MNKYAGIRGQSFAAYHDSQIIFYNCEWEKTWTNNIIGFRCVYTTPATNTKHRMRGSSYITECHPSCITNYSMSYEPRSNRDIGARCVYIVRNNPDPKVQTKGDVSGKV